MCQSIPSKMLVTLYQTAPVDTFSKEEVFQPPPLFFFFFFNLLETSQSRYLSLHSGYNTWAHCILIYLFTCLSSLELFEGKDNFLCDLISQNPAKT